MSDNVEDLDPEQTYSELVEAIKRYLIASDILENGAIVTEFMVLTTVRGWDEDGDEYTYTGRVTSEMFPPHHQLGLLHDQIEDIKVRGYTPVITIRQSDDDE